MQLSLSPSKPKPKLAPKVKAYTPAAEKKEQRGAITRFLPPNRDEAFIAFMPNSAEVRSYSVLIIALGTELTSRGPSPCSSPAALHWLRSLPMNSPSLCTLTDPHLGSRTSSSGSSPKRGLTQ